jgi:hypothetical protein
MPTHSVFLTRYTAIFDWLGVNLSPTLQLPQECNDNSLLTKWYSPSGVDAELLLTFPSTVV